MFDHEIIEKLNKQGICTNVGYGYRCACLNCLKELQKVVKELEQTL